MNIVYCEIFSIFVLRKVNGGGGNYMEDGKEEEDEGER